MSFKNAAGTAIVPTLARLVLGAAFITQGYNKVFNQTEFSGEAAQRLIKLDVIDPATATAMRGGGEFRLASYQAEEPQDAGGETPDAAPDATPDEPPADAVTDEGAPDEADSVIEEVTEAVEEGIESIKDQIEAGPTDVADLPEIPEGAVFEAKAMYHVTVLVDQAGWPEPVWLGRIAAFTEIIGGGLLLLGVFSRIWGLGLAITMGVAFYLTSMSYFDAPLAAAQGQDGYALFNQVFTQLGLFVLAFGIMLTGPGPLSVDRLLFRPREKEEIDDIAFS